MPFILPDALTEDRKRHSSMINCRSDPSLVSYRHIVGYRRLPGNPAPHVTRSIGECRMSLWSALVISLRLCGMPDERPRWWPSGGRRGHRVPA